MQRLTRCVWIVATIALAVPAGAFAQKSLTWQQVKDQFQATNPTLLAGRIGIDEAKAQETTAYLRPNPDMTTTFDQIAPFNGNPYRPFGSALPLVSASHRYRLRGQDRAFPAGISRESAGSISIERPDHLRHGGCFADAPDTGRTEGTPRSRRGRA